MPPLKPDTELALVRFLGGEWRDAIDGLRLDMQTHETKDEERHAELMRERGSVSARLEDLEDRSDKLEDRHEQTGRHHMVRLESEMTELKKEQATTGRHGITTVLSVVFGLVGFVAALLSMLLRK